MSAPVPGSCYADTTTHGPHVWMPFVDEGPRFSCPGVKRCRVTRGYCRCDKARGHVSHGDRVHSCPECRDAAGDGPDAHAKWSANRPLPPTDGEVTP